MPVSVERNYSEDAAAVEQTLAGDREAYRFLVERHSASVFRLAYRMTGNRQDAEEVVQEAFTRAYQKLEQFGARAGFGTWVYRIAANYAIDRMRQKKSEESRRERPGSADPERDDENEMALVADERPTPERLMASGQLGEKIRETLDAMSAAERTAVMMRHWEGCGIDEIAKALELNISATKNTVFRAVQKLRKALEPLAQTRGRAMGMSGE